MSLYKKYKPGMDKLFIESLNRIITEDQFYEKTRSKFDALEKEIEDLSDAKSQEILSKSIISRIQKVHNRILLIRDLRAKVDNAENYFQVYMYPGLVTYLYLTCFDQLGTPSKGWHFFPDWVDSKSHRKEVEEAILESKGKFENNNLGGIKSIIKDIYNQYHTLHGVKNSFFRFLREILPTEMRNTLLGSVLVEKWTNRDEQVLGFGVDEAYKEKWLYDTRNNYTHNLFTTETNITDGKVLEGTTWLIRERILKEDGTNVIWVSENFNSILESCIIYGIKVLI